MQVQKEEVRNKILESALNEFKDKGYQKASVRQIAKNAGMTEGNIYRYFKSKKSILEELVGPLYDNTMRLMKLYEKEERNIEDIDSYVIKYLVDINKKYNAEMFIILEGCKGTKFENAKDEIISLTESNINNMMIEEAKHLDFEIRHPFVSHAIAKGFIEGMICIFKEFGNSEELEEILWEYHDFYCKNGFRKLS